MSDKLIQLEQEYLKLFPKSELIAWGFTYYEPNIESLEQIERIYEKCIKEKKKWENFYKVVGFEGVKN